MLLPSIFKLHNLYCCKIPDILGGKCPPAFYISGQPSTGLWQSSIKLFPFCYDDWCIRTFEFYFCTLSMSLECGTERVLWFNVDVDLDAGSEASMPLGIEGLIHFYDDWSLGHAQFIILMFLPGIVNMVCVAVGPAQSRWNSIYDRWYFSCTDKFSNVRVFGMSLLCYLMGTLLPLCASVTT